MLRLFPSILYRNDKIFNAGYSVKMFIWFVILVIGKSKLYCASIRLYHYISERQKMNLPNTAPGSEGRLIRSLSTLGS